MCLCSTAPHGNDDAQEEKPADDGDETAGSHHAESDRFSEAARCLLRPVGFSCHAVGASQSETGRHGKLR